MKRLTAAMSRPSRRWMTQYAAASPKTAPEAPTVEVSGASRYTRTEPPTADSRYSAR